MRVKHVQMNLQGERKKKRVYHFNPVVAQKNEKQLISNTIVCIICDFSFDK